MSRRLALIIGNSFYRDNTLARLSAPDVDIGSLGEVLRNPEIGNFDDARLLVNMTSAAVRLEISEFYARKKRDDLLILYFSGHGVLDENGQLFLAVKDTDPKLLRATAIPARFITDEMDNSASRRQVLILDCCHSGAFSRGAKSATGVSVGTGPSFEGTGYGRVVLTATDATQYAWEGDQIVGEAEGSLFTHYLLEGLSTGEADANGDGQITIDELYDYVYDQVVKHTARQTPGKWTYREQGEIVIARSMLPAAPPRLEAEPQHLDEELTQRIPQLYALGLSAFMMEESQKAAKLFEAIVDAQPDYQDAAALLIETQSNIRLAELYSIGQAALDKGKYAVAVEALEKIIAERPDYKDAAGMLAIASRKQKVSELYSRAKQEGQAKQWQAVIEAFNAIRNIDPDAHDPEGLLEKTHKELEIQRQQRELENRYQDALRAMKTGDWQAAQKLLNDIQKVQPEYLETTRLLKKIEAELAQQQENLARRGRVEALYGQARQLAHDHDWIQSLEKLREIQSLEPDFTDPEGLETQANLEITRLADEVKRQDELAALYLEAVRLLQNGEYQAALDTWESVKQIDPTYRDANHVEKTARKRLTIQTQGAKKIPTIKQLPRWGWIIISTILFVVVVGLYTSQQTRNPSFVVEQSATITHFVTATPGAQTTSTPSGGAVFVQTEAKPTVTPKATVVAIPPQDTPKPTAVPTPTATPQGRVKIRLVTTTSSDWSFVELTTDGQIRDISFVEIEALPDPRVQILDGEIIGLGQPIENALAGNRINAAVDVIIDFAVESVQASSSKVEFAIDKGAIGETYVEIYNMQGDEPLFLKTIKRSTEIQTVRDSIDATLLLEPPQQSAICQVSANLGKINAEYGLDHKGDGDGITTPVTSITDTGGMREARQTVKNPTPVRYLYFRVDPGYLIIKNGAKLTITVEYLDQGSAKFFIAYNSSDKTHRNPNYKETPKVVDTRNTGYWKATRFIIYDASLQNKQNLEADFRIDVGGDFDFVVNRVIVETQDCGK